MKRFSFILVLLLTVALVTVNANVPANPPNYIIKGVVMTANGEPLAGASIVVEGTNINCGSNSKGEFSLNVQKDKVYKLRVSYLGYTPRLITVPASGHPPLKIKLQPSETALNELVVTGSRYERQLKDVPVITRVISREEIETVNPVDFTTLLEYTLPGIQFYYNTMSQVPEITYQGMDAKAVLFLLDGERISGESGDSNIDYSRFNINDIERIEVVRGAASTLYDSRAIGGVINIITKKSVRPFTASMHTRYAGKKGQSYSASAGVNLHRFSSLTSFGWRKRDSYLVKDEQGKQKEIINPDGSVTKSKTDPIAFNIYGYSIMDISQKLSYNFTDRFTGSARISYYTNKRDKYDNARYYQRYRDLILSGKLKWQFADNQNLDLSYIRDNYIKDNVYVDDDERVYGNVNSTIRLYYTGMFGKHTLSGGVDLLREDMKHHFMKDTATVHMKQYSFCLQDDWQLTDKMNVVVGVRGDKGGSYRLHFTPKVSVLYRPLKTITLRAGYSQGYRIPNLKELYQEFNMGGMGIMMYGNKDLKPEEGTQISASVEYDYKGLNLSVSTYHNRYKNKISYEYISPGKSWNMKYVNALNVKTTGVEVTANYKLPFGLRFSGGYSYVYDYDERDGYNMSWVRPHSARLSSVYKHRFGKTTESVAFNTSWVSSITRYAYSSSDKTYTKTKYDPRTLCSLNLRSELPRGIAIGLMVDNIFNYRDKAVDSAVQLPENGRTFVATVSINIADMFKL
ncbi:TonB-dependent receptor [Prevotella sp. HMSC077E09]|uniref:TonB-dependent receptor n=1 Tax=Prevotella sp. HMSC077E09 TaxID=1739487 RepID=UPI0008A2B263|nr:MULTISPECIES: TonB-dependent receptor [unclassified Prevotella]OFO72991.1 TonB-dependent receptor [Prevotella sp. HMSC077E08]OFP57941.1 TonB-dependent receptor [Prevotella sp. HMSC077E09]